MFHKIFQVMQDPALNTYIITQAKKKYNIKAYNLQKMNFKIALQTLNMISMSSQLLNLPQNLLEYQNYIFFQDKWQQNELRLFLWLLFGYCYLQQSNIQSMKQDQFSFFEEVFVDKSKQFLFYKSRLILNLKTHRWEIAETKLLQKIIKSKIRNQIVWNKISIELYFLSGKKYIKSAKKCRQIWFNHLNPQLKRSSWDKDQDVQLIDLAILLGPKWAKIAKRLSQVRNEHMVKNRFVQLTKLYKIKLERTNNNHVLNELKQKIIQKINVDKSSRKQKKRTRQSIQWQQSKCLQKNTEIKQKQKVDFQMRVQTDLVVQNRIKQSINKIQQLYNQSVDDEPVNQYKQFSINKQISIDIEQYLTLY